MANETIIIYGADWCGDCRRAKAFLKQHNVAHQWIDVEKDERALFEMLQKSGGRQNIPVLIFPDGEMLIEPSNYELSQKIGTPQGAR